MGKTTNPLCGETITERETLYTCDLPAEHEGAHADQEAEVAWS